jgi:hypothetical protein
MATIFASDPADFGRQLSQRAALQAQLNSRAADNSARFAFEAQRMRQEQANRNAAMMAAAAQQAADRRFSVAATDRNQRFALEQQDMAAKRAAADREARFKFEAVQGDLNRQARASEAATANEANDLKFRFSAAYDAASRGTFADIPDEKRPAQYQAAFGIDSNTASAMADLAKQMREQLTRQSRSDRARQFESYYRSLVDNIDIGETAPSREQALAEFNRFYGALQSNQPTADRAGGWTTEDYNAWRARQGQTTQ